MCKCSTSVSQTPHFLVENSLYTVCTPAEVQKCVRGGKVSDLQPSLHMNGLLLRVCPKWAKLCKNHTEEKSVVMLIVCSSAHRVLDFIKQLTTFKGNSKVLKLFAKHIKVEEQIKLLQKGVAHMGTPGRIKALAEQDGLSVKALKYVVLDWNWSSGECQTSQRCDQECFTGLLRVFQVDYTEERDCAECYTLRLDRANSIIDCACTVSFSLSEAFKGDVFMYYGLTNFHQNQRHYMVSRDNAQLVGRQYNKGTARPFYWRKPVYQLSVEKNNNGFVNEDLIVWMRQAAFPSFKKLYRRLNRTQEFSEGLPAGNYSVKISYRFNAMNTSGIIRGMQGNNWTEADLEFVQRMKNEKSVMQLKEETIDRTVQLGRAFLCRKMDPSIVEPLCPESVLKQLSVASVQQVIQQETAKLQALEEKLTGKQKQASHQIKQLQIEMRNKEMYYLEKIKSHKERVLMEQELVDNLKDELSELQEKLAETQEHFKSMKSQIEDLQAKQMENYSGTVNMAKIEQRLKRLERRKELFLERRRIMQRLCSMDR
ncbi:hypothetical protein EOD39_7319 [Acipenser ruthenus]|uniref:Uncharacterized protein n=1 Tax=Acipenser ruthenus TaxID=7906 RepID=A0A662YXP5_ACIRT|nr:hypothetical protein EOD39_7319 [Acipenser ruthenus]